MATAKNVKKHLCMHIFQCKHYSNSFDNTTNLVSIVKYALTTQSICPLLHRQISAVVYFK